MFQIANYPLASKASREVAILTERKNLHTPVYGVKELVCLSVCLSVCPSVINFDPKYCRTGRTVHISNSSFIHPKQKTISKKFASKTVIFLYLTKNNYLYSRHSQGVWNLQHNFHVYLILTETFYKYVFLPMDSKTFFITALLE